MWLKPKLKKPKPLDIVNHVYINLIQQIKMVFITNLNQHVYYQNNTIETNKDILTVIHKMMYDHYFTFMLFSNDRARIRVEEAIKDNHSLIKDPDKLDIWETNTLTNAELTKLNQKLILIIRKGLTYDSMTGIPDQIEFIPNQVYDNLNHNIQMEIHNISKQYLNKKNINYMNLYFTLQYLIPYTSDSPIWPASIYNPERHLLWLVQLEPETNKYSQVIFNLEQRFQTSKPFNAYIFDHFGLTPDQQRKLLSMFINLI